MLKQEDLASQAQTMIYTFPQNGVSCLAPLLILRLMALPAWQAWWKGAVKHFPGRDFGLVMGHFFQMAKAHVTDGRDLAV